MVFKLQICFRKREGPYPPMIKSPPHAPDNHMGMEVEIPNIEDEVEKWNRLLEGYNAVRRQRQRRIKIKNGSGPKFEEI
jgi:hypothetical protein